MSIEIKINASARVRQLKREHPYMTPADIAKLTGTPLKNVRAALSKREARDKPKSKVVEARGPLTAAEVAEKLRLPLSHARLVTGG